MCGLFGVLKKSKDKINPEEFRDAVDSLAHRGPDDVDCWIQESIALGHRRLAIFDTSVAGRQPFFGWNKVLVFNGAIYNFPELKKKLNGFGYIFKTETDTEVLLAAYDHWGEACVQYFNGQWGFAIYDLEKETLFCSRDRFGIKPFYYTWIDGDFYFSSEIKAFQKISGWKSRLNQTRAYEYLAHGMHDHTAETFFKGVFQLRGGHNLLFSKESKVEKIKSYYDVKKIDQSSVLENEAVDQFSTIFKEALRLRLRADVKVGAALSGGLDSSSIVLTIPEVRKVENFSTFSVVYKDKKISEEKYVKAVLDKAEVEAQILSPDYNYYKKSRKQILWHQEAPYNGIGVEAQYAMFEKVRGRGVSVMLDGQGADEILAGYEKFYWGWMQANKLNPIKNIRLIYQVASIHDFSPQAVWSVAKSYFLSNKKMHQDIIKISPEEDKCFRRKSEKSIRQMSENLLSGLGLSALLHYEDKNAMAFGIESRVPFLDHHLVEFCLSLPDDLKIKNGIRKWILRESRKKVLPKNLLTRYDKLGFATPENDWLKSERNHFIQTIKSNQKLETIIEKTILESIEDMKLLWRIYLLGEWMDLFEVEV